MTMDTEVKMLLDRAKLVKLLRPHEKSFPVSVVLVDTEIAFPIHLKSGKALLYIPGKILAQDAENFTVGEHGIARPP